jgi:hypothetical protein
MGRQLLDSVRTHSIESEFNNHVTKVLKPAWLAKGHSASAFDKVACATKHKDRSKLLRLSDDAGAVKRATREHRVAAPSIKLSVSPFISEQVVREMNAEAQDSWNENVNLAFRENPRPPIIKIARKEPKLLGRVQKINRKNLK